MSKKIAFFIFILAAVIRLSGLNHVPNGVNADEAALGYNAWSLLLTGADEHGHPWPVNLESFADYKPAGYAYVLIPFIRLFGLSPWVLRLPSALAGVGSVVCLYLIIRRLFPNRPGIAPLAAFLLSISPWHLHFSRGAWEVNLASFFILLGTYLWLKWQSSCRWQWFTLSGLFFIAAAYTYQAARILAPLTLIYLAISSSRLLRRNLRSLSFGLIILIFAAGPLVAALFISPASSRFSGVGWLADLGPYNRQQELRGQHQTWSTAFTRLLHNRPVAYTLRLASNYLDHFSPDFLYISGDVIPRSRVPDSGLLFISDALFIFIGVLTLMRRGGNSGLIWFWLLIAPIPAAITFQTPHALRAQFLVFPLLTFSALGIDTILTFKSPPPWRRSIFLLVGLLLIWQSFRWWHQYLIHYPQTYPAAWEYGFSQLADYLRHHQQNYSRILITNYYDQPYILLLYWLAYPPSKFQHHHQLTVRDQFNFSTVSQFDRYVFTDTSWDKIRDIHSALIVAAPQDIPEQGVHVVHTINFPDGSPALKIISN